jgi:hypothetical protein
VKKKPAVLNKADTVFELGLDQKQASARAASTSDHGLGILLIFLERVLKIYLRQVHSGLWQESLWKP